MLQIKSKFVDAIPVYEEPSNKSPEISKTAHDQLHLYSDSKNGYHKITVGGKDGCVLSKNIEILSSKK